jgi:hypothetical protein
MEPQLLEKGLQFYSFPMFSLDPPIFFAVSPFGKSRWQRFKFLASSKFRVFLSREIWSSTFSRWWFGTWFLFFHILGIIIPID